MTRRAPWTVALSGLAALAVAMGIGRFAFTPILPMMQEELGLGLSQGSWLASANYLGYLLGALSALKLDLKPGFALRTALLVVALTTLAMALAQGMAAWLALRFLPGLASAWILIYGSAWALDKLALAGRATLGGVVYAGVGIGIVFAGMVCLVLAHAGFGSAAAWSVLGGASLLALALLWPLVGEAPSPAAPAPHAPARKVGGLWRFVFCHGALGVGYIIPATFLPVMAKRVIADPAVFGWAWPLFGAAAMASTLLAARAAAAIGGRRVWLASNLVMGAGLVVPLLLPGLPGIVLAALAVGGTFVVTTMVGLQEARRAAGADARRWMAAMTSAFALGQIVGPLLVASLVRFQSGFAIALVAAAIPLFFAAFTLWEWQPHDKEKLDDRTARL